MNQAPIKKKRALYNGIMAAAIVAILLSGIMVVANLQGWFEPDAVSPQPTNNAANMASSALNDSPVSSETSELKTMHTASENMSSTSIAEAGASSTQLGMPGAPEATRSITVKDKTGSANIERSGIAYSLKNGNTLRDGDIVETLNGSSLTLAYNGGQIYLSQNTEVGVHINAVGSISLDLACGEGFISISQPLQVNLMGQSLMAENGVYSVYAAVGSAGISTLNGSADIGGMNIRSGQAASVLNSETSVRELSIQTLNDFTIAKIREVEHPETLCFTPAQINQLEAEREAEINAAKEEQRQQNEKEQEIIRQRDENKTDLKSQTTTGSNGNGGTATDTSLTCTIEIRCDSILDNMGDLAEGKDKYVPSDGVILDVLTMTFKEGESVFNVLKRACSLKKIQLEFSWTPLYDSYYVEGMNHLYEFDCGNESGWMYKVNGWFPNYGCSSYFLEDGDVITWEYTCQGLGGDVGGGV